mmetsp:Transcript_21092/g.41374  ORF Transcript_21092/g.41374 Transcript_21092/m.41374 type:complete len:516 (+) Transcript_21092:178-1725(+)
MPVGKEVVVTLRAVATVCAVQVFGIALVRAGIITRPTVRVLSKLVQEFFLPASVFIRIGSILTLELLRSMWMLPLVYICMVFVNVIFARLVLLPFSGSPKWFRPWFVLTVSFPNMVAIPLIFVREFCTMLTFEADGKPMTVEECTAQGELFLFFAGQLVTFTFWMVGPEMVARAGSSTSTNPGVEGTNRERYARVAADEEADLRVLDIRRSSSLDYEKERHLRRNSEDGLEMSTNGRLHTHRSTYEDSGASGSNNNSNVAGDNNSRGSLVDDEEDNRLDMLSDQESINGVDDGLLDEENEKTSNSSFELEGEARATSQSREQSSRFCSKKLCATIIRVLSRPPTIAQLIAAPIALTPILHSAVFDHDSVLAPVVSALTTMSYALVPCMNLVVSGSLGLSFFEPKNESHASLFAIVPRRTLAILLISRMLILPMASFSALCALQPTLFGDSENTLMMAVMFMSVCTPTSNGSVVLLSNSEDPNAADALSLVVLGQYLLGLFSMTSFLIFTFRHLDI